MVFIFCVVTAFFIWFSILFIGYIRKNLSLNYSREFNKEFCTDSLELKQLVYQSLVGGHVNQILDFTQPIDVKFNKLGKNNSFIFWLIEGQADNELQAYVQGDDESFSFSIKKELDEINYSLVYDSDRLWKKGCAAIVWPKIKRKAQAALNELHESLIELSFEAFSKEPVPLEIDVSENLIEKKEKKFLNVLSPAFFEIPISDIARAKWFYSGVFGFEFVDEEKDTYWFSHFRYIEGEFLGALVFGEGYIPQQLGSDPFLKVERLDLAKELIQNYGGHLLIDYLNINGNRISKFVDSEGNRLGLIAI